MKRAAMRRYALGDLFYQLGSYTNNSHRAGTVHAIEATLSFGVSPAML
jgi:hypothetical protein